MLKMIYMLCFAAILVGCSMANDKLENLPLETSLEPTSIVTSRTNAEETNTPTSTPTNTPTETNILVPQYIDESKYEGDELGVVKTLNNMLKAMYEFDVDAYHSLTTGPEYSDDPPPYFSKIILSFDNLDFTVKPYPKPPDDAIPVWLEKTSHFLSKEETYTDTQLYVFQFEDDIWKLLYIADHWQF